MADKTLRGGGGPDVPFVFVPHGDPVPAKWMARHPGWVKFPATLVPRPAIGGSAGRDGAVQPAAASWPMGLPAFHGAPVRRRRPVPVDRLPAPGPRGQGDPIDACRRADAVFAAIGGVPADRRPASSPPATSNLQLHGSESIRDFIHMPETRGHLDRVAHLHWPGGASGVTLGAD